MNSQVYKKHVIKKHLGQIFLKDKHVINLIIEAINPKNNQSIVEIGPGLAALTEPISKYLDQLTVIEVDYNLIKRLQNNLLLRSKLLIYQQDVLVTNFSMLSKRIGQPLRIVGNLPYCISTEIIFHLFKYIDIISDMHLMLQEEVANRLISRINNRKYGRLSIMAQYYCQIFHILKISPHSFIPKPKVNSVLVRLIPHTMISYPVENIKVFNYIVAKAFNQRRKIISNSLSNLFTRDMLVALGIDPQIRAENITVTKYCQMANYISHNNILL